MNNHDKRRKIRGVVCGAIVLLAVGCAFFALEFFFPRLHREFMGLVVMRRGHILTTADLQLALWWSRILPMLCLLTGLVMLLCAMIMRRSNTPPHGS